MLGELGFSGGLLLVQLFSLAILIAWPLLSIVALLRLRRRALGQTPQVLWTVLVVVIPLLGAIAFFVVQPGESLDKELT